jgi:hypothetical protein
MRTTCIKQLVVSVLLSILTSIKSSCNLTGKCFEMPNDSYTEPSDCAKTQNLIIKLLYLISIFVGKIFGSVTYYAYIQRVNTTTHHASR